MRCPQAVFIMPTVFPVTTVTLNYAGEPTEYCVLTARCLLAATRLLRPWGRQQ